MRLVVSLVPVFIAVLFGVLARDSGLVWWATDRWDIHDWEAQVAVGVVTFLGLMLLGFLSYLYWVAHDFPRPG